jgi:hypothetical protein
VFDGAAREPHRLVHVERLGQVLEGAAAVGGDRALEIGVRGHDDDRDLRRPGADGLEQLQAADAGHADVGDHHVRPLAVQQPGTSFAESKLFTAMSSWLRAFSSTQRMERSSSMTQADVLSSHSPLSSGR